MSDITRRTALAASAGALGLLATVRRAEAGEAAAGIDNFAFTPADLRVPAGTTVTWTNRDDIPQTVTSTASPLVFRSQPLDTDDRFSFRFDSPGTYRYFCALHPHMQGAVVVT